MTMKRFALLYLALIAILPNACKKEDPPVEPSAAFTASKTTAVVDEEITFTNNSQDATSYTWSFGDGTTSTETSPKKSYATSSVFTVTLSALGPGGTKVSTQQVTVLPYVAFTVENENALTTTAPVKFTSTSKGATSYQWTFGDAANSTSTDANPSFTYSAAGTYTVTLKAISSAGQSTASKQITVAAPPASKELFYVEYNAGFIRKLTLDGSGTVSNVLDLTGIAGPGLAIDQAGGKIYFSDFEVTGEGKIWRMNLDGTGLESIVTGLVDPYGIALDLTAGKVYWADDDGNISRANLDGTNLQTGIVNIAGGQMRAVALDPANNKMYFYEVNLENLYVANLDGSNPSILISGVYGYAILVDSQNGKLYFDDQNANGGDGALVYTNLDGTGRSTISAVATRIYGMAIDYTENKLYWSGRDSGELNRANLDGTDPEVLKDGLSSPRGIILKL